MARAEGFDAAASAYDRFVGRYGRQLAEQLADLAGVRAPMRALDVGCGPGALTGVLAERLGAQNVAAVEPSEPFAAACRERTGVDVQVAAGEALPFGDDSFDVALSQLVVNFMQDPGRGVGEMARVAPVVASAVWDYAGEMKLLRAFWDAAVALAPEARGLDEGRRMPYCTADELLGLWREVGLQGAEVSALEVRAGYADMDDLWAPIEAGVGPAGVYAKGLDAAGRSALREEMWRRLGSPSGAFELTARAWAVVGARPR
jgi:SAM-dependent methyltransferase